MTKPTMNITVHVTPELDREAFGRVLEQLSRLGRAADAAMAAPQYSEPTITDYDPELVLTFDVEGTTRQSLVSDDVLRWLVDEVNRARRGDR